ncbi:Rha family transcriptional regulator [Pseudothauera nasutitermitis]|uniref:Rha family transcriptional regulator n=1 Tax=Pseudothauera nasutitermitis TaxID=2565930 RepID=UPI001454DE1D|nr:Rha family transcriptional regulator [Pseudothauera nasutitermitis]
MLPEPHMPEIVVEHHGEPMTTSLAIADGVKIEHASVIKLVRKYAEDIGAFGEIGFEIRLNPHGKPTEIAWLNEQQSTFLLTLMRNSPIVVEFKKALVRAFFALRDRVRAAHAAPGPFLTGNPAHAADQLVSADRIFRSILRSCRSAGLPLPRALARANEVARHRTGIDLLEELDAPDLTAGNPALFDPLGVHAFCDAWLSGAVPLPALPCRSADLHAAYRHWRAASGEPAGILPRVIAAMTRRPDLRHRRARYLDEAGRAVMAGFVLPEHELMPPAGVLQPEWLTARAREFAHALATWRSPPG